ncbi:MAG: retention module-containing protein [Neptuniibacter sp.]
MNIIGTVSHLVGQVFAIKADGSERLLALGDPVYADEMVRVSPGGAIEISMDSGELVKLEGGQNWLATAETYQEAGDFDLSEATADIQSIQEAILAGVDPTEVTEATAAGGEPAAGAEGDEGSSTVVVNRTAEEVDPTAGYDTIGFQDTFEQPEEELLFTPEAPDEPVVSVSVQVEVQVGVTTEVDLEDPDSEDPFEETGENVVLSPQGVLVLEGTESGDDTETRDITFNLVLDKVFDQDVQVTYQLRPVSTDGSADYPEDWYDLTLDPITVTIPAGTVSLPVVVTIVQDHVDEANGQFEIVLLSAENATINSDANSEQIFIIDDDTTPVAQDDFNSLMEDAYLETDEQYPDSGYPSTEGNVIAGEHDDSDFSPASQADTDEDGDSLIVVSFGDADETAAPGATITGEYGTLTLNEDGSYQYVLTSNNEDDIQGLSEGDTLEDVFSYVVTDTYNENQSATLTITIEGKDDGVSITGLSSEGAEEFVSEVNLSDGSAPNTGALTQGGSFSFEAKDGLDTVSIGGQNFNLSALSALDGAQTVAMSFGTLVLTGYVGDAFGGTISYEYTLDDNVDNDSQASADDFGFRDSIAVVVTDEDGSSDNETLDVFIADDIPVAEADSDKVTEGLGNSVNGNVLTNDEGGADLLDSSTLSWTGSLVGTYGTLSDDGAGNWTYTLTAASVPPDATDSFDYTVEDSDGDVTGETLTISIDQDTNIPNVVGDAQTVYEDGLADGVQHGADSETTTGSFTVDANGEDYTLTLNSDTISAVGDTVDTGTGILTITGINQVGDVVTYDYNYTLSAPLTHADGSGENTLTDTISMSVTDATGDSDATPGNIVVTIVDDVPVITSSQNSIMTNVVGNEVTGAFNISYGADGPGSLSVALTAMLVTTDGSAVTLTQTDANTWLGHTGAYGVDEGPVFELSVDPVDQTYTFDLLGPDLIAAFEQKQAGQGSSFGSGPANAYIIPDAVDPSADLVLISGYEIGDLSDFDLTTADFDDIHSDDNTVFADVNLQNNYYGVDTPAVGVDQALVMDFTGDNFGYTLPGEFDGPIVTSITIGIQKSATISWVAYNDAGEVINSDTDLAVVKNQSLVISGENNEFISYVVVYGETGATGVVVQSVGTLSNTGITDVTFDVTATDSDGDVTLPAEISVTVDGSGDIRGTDAGEVISGASGNNILTGGLGDDVFFFTAEDQGTVGTPDLDIINDFNDNGEADVLDLSDLLVGEEGTDLTAFLAVSEDAGAVVIDVDPDGLSGNTEQIRLEGTTLADLGANAVDTQADIISDLITNGHIQVDS